MMHAKHWHSQWHPAEYRGALLGLLSRPDQMATEAERIHGVSVYADAGVMAEKLQELLANMRAKVEEKLDQIEV